MFRQWPLLSIDITSATKRTGLQQVRYEGGIEDTQLGADLFRVGLDLKRITLGVLAPRDVRQQATNVPAVFIRLWFYPIVHSVLVRDDVVAVRGLRLGVFSETTKDLAVGVEQQAGTIDDPIGNQFARALTEKFDTLARAHSSLQACRGSMSSSR